MFGYSFFLPKEISYFLIYDVDFYCFIDFTHSIYSLVKIRFHQYVFPCKKGHNLRKKVCNFQLYASHCDVILLLPEVNMLQLFVRFQHVFIIQCFVSDFLVNTFCAKQLPLSLRRDFFKVNLFSVGNHRQTAEFHAQNGFIKVQA